MGSFSLNFNERPTMRLLCCLYAYKPVFFCFHKVWEAIFESRILTVTSLFGFYFEIANFNEALI